jgi:phosphate:Na+ symporter
MLRQISELESIGDSCYHLGRTLNRKRQYSKEDFTEKQMDHMETMLDLVDKALAEMVRKVAQLELRPNINQSYNIENEINNYRTQLKNQNLNDVNAGVYSYQLGVFYVDFICECEKCGDYVINVVQAGRGLNNDYEISA